MISHVYTANSKEFGNQQIETICEGNVQVREKILNKHQLQSNTSFFLRAVRNTARNGRSVCTCEYLFILKKFVLIKSPERKETGETSSVNSMRIFFKVLAIDIYSNILPTIKTDDILQIDHKRKQYNVNVRDHKVQRNQYKRSNIIHTTAMDGSKQEHSTISLHY